MEVLHVLTDWGSQQYVEKMREASMRGLREKVDLELFPQGEAPFGYTLIGKKKNTTVELDESEAKVVRQIFDLYLGRVGCAEIARILNREHAPTPRGEPWTERSVRKILNKTCYYGVWYAFTMKTKKLGNNRVQVIRLPDSQGIPIPFPAIVTKAEWTTVQRMLKSHHVGRKEEYQYLMATRITCTCKASMIGQRNRNGKTPKLYYYYRCNSQYGKKGSCGMSKWQVEPVDKTVWQFAMDLISDPEKLLEGYRTMQETEVERYNSLATQIANLDEEIGNREEELSSIVDQRTKSKSNTLNAILDQKAEEYAGIIDSLKARRTILLDEQADDPLTDFAIDEMVTEIEALRGMYEALHHIDETADFTAQRQLIDLLNLRATLRVDENGEKWVDIAWGSQIHERRLWVESSPQARGSAARTC